MSVLFYDLIIVGILLVFVILGARRGMILSLCGMVAILVALSGASVGAKTLAPQVSAVLEPRFAAAIEEQLNKEISSSIENGRTGFEENTLTGLLGFLRDMGLYRELADAVELAIESGMTSVAAAVAARAAAAMAETVAYPLLFFLFFFLIMLIWTLASYLLDLAFRFPVLSGLNRLGGAAFGLIKGVVIVFLLVWLLRRFAMLPLPEELAQTKLLYFFANTNPLTLFLP